MEIDIIHELIQERPSWLKPFPITYAVEYYIDPDPCKGRGDLIVCNEKYDQFLVVEVKRTKRKNKKLLRQMIFYHSQFKMKMPDVTVDCAAVAKGDLLVYMKDGMSDFTLPELSDSRNKKMPRLLPKPRRFDIQRYKRPVLLSNRLTFNKISI